MLGSAERRKVRLIIREIIFEELRRVWSQSTNVTDRRTDGQLIVAIPRYATLRAVKNVYGIFRFFNTSPTLFTFSWRKVWIMSLLEFDYANSRQVFSVSLSFTLDMCLSALSVHFDCIKACLWVRGCWGLLSWGKNTLRNADCGMLNVDHGYFAECGMRKKTCGMRYNLRNGKTRKSRLTAYKLSLASMIIHNIPSDIIFW